MNDTVAENMNRNVADGVAQGEPGAPPQNNNRNNCRGGVKVALCVAYPTL